MREALISRLRPYWKMEAANTIFLPAVGIIVVSASGGVLSWLLAIAMFAASWLLIVGTIALRAHYLTVAGDRLAMDRALPFLGRCQLPSAALCLASFIAAGIQFWQDSAWTPTAIATWVFAALAALEYVNYYHVQLQNFDHRPDLDRLVAGKGLRKSHLARSLARYRASR